MTPDSPLPPLDLAPILARADQLAEARAKVGRLSPQPKYHSGLTLEEFASMGSTYLEALDSFGRLARNLAIEEDVRAMAAEIERMRKLVGACRELIRGVMHCQFPLAVADDNGDSAMTVAHRLGQALDLIDAAQGPH